MRTSLFRGRVESKKGIVYTRTDYGKPLDGHRKASEANSTPPKKKAKKKKKTNDGTEDHVNGEGANGLDHSESVDKAVEVDKVDPPKAVDVDKTSSDWTGVGVASHTRKALKEKSTFSFGFNITEEAQDIDERNISNQEASPSIAEPAGNFSNTIYVGGLPFEVQDVEIEQYFSEYGNIEGIDRLKFSDSGRFRGIAFITFDSVRSAKKALQADGQAFSDERYLVVRKYNKNENDVQKKPVERTSGYHRVYIGNLPWDFTEERLRELFADYTIKFLRLSADQDGNFKGFAHLHFASEEDVDKAMQLNGEYVEGRQLKVSHAIPPRR